MANQQAPRPNAGRNEDDQDDVIDTGNDSRGGNTVTVGCKLPHGLEIHTDQGQVVLNGANASQIIGGYGMTAVDKGFMDAWMKNHQHAPYVKNGAIFIVGSDKEAQKEAQKRESVRTGFEGVNAKVPLPGADVTEEEDTAAGRKAGR